MEQNPSTGRVLLLVRTLLWVSAIVAVGAALFALRYHDKLIDLGVFLKAGERLLHAESLYQSADGHYQFKYLPAAAVLFAPLAALPETAGRFIWFVAMIGAIVAVVRLSARLTAIHRPVGWGVITLTVLVMLRFYARELDLGQSNAIMAAIALCGASLTLSKRDITGGLLLGIAAALKPYAVILLLPYLIRRRLSLLASAIGVIVVLSLTALARYGWSTHSEMLVTYSALLSQSSAALLTNPDNISFFGAWAKWVGTEHAGASGAATVLLALGALAVAAHWVTTRAARQEVAGNQDTLFIELSALMCLIPLASPQGWDYTFLIATPAVMLVVTFRDRMGKWLRYASYGSLAVIGLAYFDLLGRDLYRAFMSSSVLTAAFALLYFALLNLRREGRFLGVPTDHL